MRWMQLDDIWRWVLRLWLGCELLFITWAAWVSSVYPRWLEEYKIDILPFSTTMSTWLERILLLPLFRYDVLWYVRIAKYGYGYKLGDTAFHPLYPLLMSILGRLFGGSQIAYMLAAWLIAQFCTVIMLYLLYKLVLLDYDHAVAQRTTLFLILSPLGFSFLIPYTEPLLMMCIVGSIYAARTQHWYIAGLAGAGAALTKQPGAVVILPLLWELFQQKRALFSRSFLQHMVARNLGASKSLLQPLIGIGLIPLGLLLWIIYRASLGDVTFSLSNPVSLIDALLVTPSYKDVWGEYFSWPWVNFMYALQQMRERPYFYLLINMVYMLIMLVLALYAVLRLRTSYAIYTIVLVLMNLSIVYPLWPYMGIIRRFTLIFPIFIQLGLLGKSRLITTIILMFSIPIWVLISSMYVRNSFVP